jgi:hypothetical protein
MSNPRDHENHPSHVLGAEATDSAGETWTGRALSPSGFETDSGAADPALREALDGSDEELMAAVTAGRFLVPIVAEPVELDTSGPLVTDAHVDMAMVTLVAPDGQRALPAFTGVDSLAAWDPQARPSPVTAERMAQAAVSERCDVIVVDVSGPRTRVLRSSMVWALAQQRTWQPPATDPFVDRSVAAALAAEEAVTAYALLDDADGVLAIELTLRAGLAPEHVQALAQRVGERLATDGEFRARIDGLAFRLR